MPNLYRRGLGSNTYRPALFLQERHAFCARLLALRHKLSAKCGVDIYIKALRSTIPLLAGLVAGCSLQDRTVDIGRTVGAIYTSQVLQNLYTLADDPQALPSNYSISKGSIQTGHSINPGLTVPLGNSVTRGVNGAGITEVAGAYNALGLQYTEGLTQSWDIVPAKDAGALRRLRAVYRYALGQIGSREMKGDFNDLEKFNSGTADNVKGFVKQCSGLYNADETKGNSGCVKIASLATPCQKDEKRDRETKIADHQNFVCLTKYNSFNDDFLHQRVILILEGPYDNGALVSLVLLSLEVQAEGEQRAGYKAKHAETLGDEDAKSEHQTIAGTGSPTAKAKPAGTAAITPQSR